MPAIEKFGIDLNTTPIFLDGVLQFADGQVPIGIIEDLVTRHTDQIPIPPSPPEDGLAAANKLRNFQSSISNWVPQFFEILELGASLNVGACSAEAQGR